MSASQPTPGGAAAAPATNDPSMEDILASIRRILSEDEPASATASAGAAAEPAPPQEKPDDVLVLDSSMLVEEEQEPEPEPEAEQQEEQQPEPLPAVIAAPAPVEVELSPPIEIPQPELLPSTTLLAPETAAAATSSVSNLMRTLATGRALQVRREGPTIEDIVREELRPLLKSWLDANLPDMVERLVQTEIERVVGRAMP